MEAYRTFGLLHNHQTISNFRKLKSELPLGSDGLKNSSSSSYLRRKRSRHSDESQSSSENLSKYKWLQKEIPCLQQEKNINDFSEDWLLTDHRQVGFFHSTTANRKQLVSHEETIDRRKNHVLSLRKPTTVDIKEENTSDITANQRTDSFTEKAHSTRQKRARKNTGEKPHKCEECGKEYRQKLHLILHQRVHTQANDSKCDACGTSLQQLPCHVLPIFKCDDCGRDFSQKLQLVLHQRIHKRALSKLSLSATSLSTTSLSATSLSANSVTSSEDSLPSCSKKVSSGVEKPFKCDECEKEFSQELRMALHKRVHGTERLYKCPECGMPFSQLASLNYHKLVHGGKTKHTCELCSAKSHVNKSTPVDRAPSRLNRKRSATCV